MDQSSIFLLFVMIVILVIIIADRAYYATLIYMLAIQSTGKEPPTWLLKRGAPTMKDVTDGFTGMLEPAPVKHVREAVVDRVLPRRGVEAKVIPELPEKKTIYDDPDLSQLLPGKSPGEDAE